MVLLIFFLIQIYKQITNLKIIYFILDIWVRHSPIEQVEVGKRDTFHHNKGHKPMVDVGGNVNAISLKRRKKQNQRK